MPLLPAASCVMTLREALINQNFGRCAVGFCDHGILYAVKPFPICPQPLVLSAVLLPTCTPLQYF